MGQYAPTATPGVRVYASDDSTEPQEPTTEQQEAALTSAINYIQSARTQLAAFDDANTLDQKKAYLDAASTALGEANKALDSVTSDDISVPVGEETYSKSRAQTLVSETETAVSNAYQAIQILLDTKNLGEALDSARAAQSSAANARSTLADEKEKAKVGIGDNPEVANDTIQTATNQLSTANNAFAQVRNDVSFSRTENGRDIEYNRAKVKQEIDAANEAIQQAELDKKEIYCVEAVYHLKNAGAKILAVYEIIENKDTTPEEAKTACEASLEEANTELNAARNAYNKLTAADKEALTKYQGIPDQIDYTQWGYEQAQTDIVVAFSTDEEKITQATVLLNSADQKLTDALDMTEDDAAAFYDKVNSAEQDYSAARKILDSVSNKNSSDYFAADTRAKQIDEEVNTIGGSLIVAVDPSDPSKKYKESEISQSVSKVTDKSTIDGYLKKIKDSAAGKNADTTNTVVYDVTLKAGNTTVKLRNDRWYWVEFEVSGYNKTQLAKAKLFHITDSGSVEQNSSLQIEERNGKCYAAFCITSCSPYVFTDITTRTPTPDANDQPVAKDAKGNTYLAKDVKVISVRYSAADAKQYIQTARKNSNAKNVDFSRAVVFNVVLMNANGDMLTMLPNHSIYVDLDMTDFKESDLKNAVLFHITDNKAEGVRCWTITNASKKCWIRFAGDSFSPYVVANIGATTSTGSDNPGTGDFSALPIILIGAAALLGIGGALVYRKKKSDAE
ncbi:MAG: LPXTG cell wall anchor domain-containing protein [Clostridia bacterium]|nr:LPXTG cell wall anchor domain-containing protein [Clostridia bacterium]